jgi:hypothetical protein
MGDKTIPFVEKAVSYCELKPDFAPRYLDIQELKKDFNAVQTITGIIRKLRPLISNLDDTNMLCGSDAYTHALTYYNSVKEAAKRNATDAKVIAEDLKLRFIAVPGNKQEEAEK